MTEPSSQLFQDAYAFIGALTGDPDSAAIDWRAIHDTNKAAPAIPFRGTISECWSSIIHYNNQGYGIFATISHLDGRGRELVNVQHVRAHFIDLDNQSAEQNFQRSLQADPAPSFMVQSSPGKYHVYWCVQPYADNDRFQLIQRKLRQFYDGDKSVVDATRVMRVPGTLHLKNPSEPFLVKYSVVGGYRHDVATLEQALSAVNVIDSGAGVRYPLGEPSMAAPSVQWIEYALNLLDPNDLDRGEWIAITSAIKQAGWSISDPDTLFDIWSAWCAKYHENDVAENLKQWNSIRDTELGWPSLLHRVPTLRASLSFGGQVRTGPENTSDEPNDTPPMSDTDSKPPPSDGSGEFLTHTEQQKYFEGCYFIVNDAKMMTPDGRFITQTAFNAQYGGKKFIIDPMGKITNEPWQAATRSTLWTVPKVDHVRFVPSRNYQEIITDELGRDGINIYRPITVKRLAGDPSMFLRHIAALLPDAGDQRILIEYMAHNAQYPGHKIPWAPVIQSTEGAGKGIIKHTMMHAMGRPYFYAPNAKELTNSGSQFNAWMRGKTFILADEIKVDDRRDLIEVLKPMISEEIIEVQGKGDNQVMEDNFSNWMFFTNWKDAVPINQNARRFACFYSALQTEADLITAGMGETYFNQLYEWFDYKGGVEIITDYLLSYPIKRGGVPHRAPKTSMHDEVIKISRSPLERVIWESIEDGLPGFRGGWISSVAVVQRARATGAVRGNPSVQAITTIVESIGYRHSGRALRAYFQEDAATRADLYFFGGVGDLSTYGRAQGYE